MHCGCHGFVFEVGGGGGGRVNCNIQLSKSLRSPSSYHNILERMFAVNASWCVKYVVLNQREFVGTFFVRFHLFCEDERVFRPGPTSRGGLKHVCKWGHER